MYFQFIFAVTLFPVAAVVGILFSTRENISFLEMFAVYYIAFAIYFLSSSLNPALYGEYEVTAAMCNQRPSLH